MHLTTRGWVTPAWQWQWWRSEQCNKPWNWFFLCKAQAIDHNSMPHSHMNASQAKSKHAQLPECVCDLLGSSHCYDFQRFQNQQSLIVCVLHYAFWCILKTSEFRAYIFLTIGGGGLIGLAGQSVSQSMKPKKNAAWVKLVNWRSENGVRWTRKLHWRVELV